MQRYKQHRPIEHSDELLYGFNGSFQCWRTFFIFVPFLDVNLYQYDRRQNLKQGQRTMYRLIFVSLVFFFILDLLWQNKWYFSLSVARERNAGGKGVCTHIPPLNCHCIPKFENVVPSQVRANEFEWFVLLADDYSLRVRVCVCACTFWGGLDVGHSRTSRATEYRYQCGMMMATVWHCVLLLSTSQPMQCIIIVAIHSLQHSLYTVWDRLLLSHSLTHYFFDYNHIQFSCFMYTGLNLLQTPQKQSQYSPHTHMDSRIRSQKYSSYKWSNKNCEKLKYRP